MLKPNAREIRGYFLFCPFDSTGVLHLTVATSFAGEVGGTRFTACRRARLAGILLTLLFAAYCFWQIFMLHQVAWFRTLHGIVGLSCLLAGILRWVTAAWRLRILRGGAFVPFLRWMMPWRNRCMSGLFLYKHFARENPAAKTIYRVSDDVRILRSTHPRLLAFEREIAPCFDCISVPNSCMQDKFPALSSLRLDLHGIDKDAYNACLASPYEPGRKNVVFVGTGYLDYNFILHVATGNPDCLFHLIGPLADKLQLPNVCFHGEMAFAQTIPYVKYADVGLHSLLYRNESSKSFSDSLKILQYRYCGLPIVSPDFMDLRHNGVFYYRPDDAKSCVHALRAALAAGNDPTRAQEVRSWTEVMQSLLDSVQSSCYGQTGDA